MKELIEDYKRRLQSVSEYLLKMNDSGSINDIKKLTRLETKASEYRTFIAELERAYNKEQGIEDLWCFQVWFGEHLSYVYLNREQAERAASNARITWRESRRAVHPEMNEIEFEMYFKDQCGSFIYKVQSLDDAIRDIVDNSSNDSR